MSKLSFTTTAMRRPELLSRTYESFAANLNGVDWSEVVLYLNIDPLPNVDSANEVAENMKEISERYFGKVVLFESEQANFAAAVQRVWSATDSDFVFHLEDDWLLLETVNIGKLFSVFRKDERVCEIPLRAYPECYDKLCLSPSLWRGSVVRSLAERLIAEKNPEIQLRSIIPNMQSLDWTKLKARPYPAKRSRVILADIGRKWLSGKPYQKPEIKVEFNKWIEG